MLKSETSGDDIFFIVSVPFTTRCVVAHWYCHWLFKSIWVFNTTATTVEEMYSINWQTITPSQMRTDTSTFVLL